MTHVAGRIILFVAALGLAASASAQGLRSDGSSEYLIKAGYIYNFAKLVEWPSAVARKGQPIVITVLGNDAFASVLDLARPLWFDPGYTSISRMAAARTGVRSVVSLNERSHLDARREP